MNTLKTIALLCALALAAGCTQKDSQKDSGKKAEGDGNASTATSRPAGDGTSKPVKPKGPHPGLKDPTKAKETAPEKFKVRFETTKGNIVLEVTRKWSPNGADRFYNLVNVGFYKDIGFFRVIPNFMAQFGMPADPKITALWRPHSIMDDARTGDTQSNLRGMLTFAKTNAPNSRGTQLFINLKDNQRLDGMGFTPIGRVVEGMDVVDSLYKTGENPRPLQQKITSMGKAAIEQQYPEADYINSATIVE